MEAQRNDCECDIFCSTSSPVCVHLLLGGFHIAPCLSVANNSHLWSA